MSRNVNGYGPYGGRYVPDVLNKALDEIRAVYEKLKDDADF